MNHNTMTKYDKIIAWKIKVHLVCFTLYKNKGKALLTTINSTPFIVLSVTVASWCHMKKNKLEIPKKKFQKPKKKNFKHSVSVSP